LTHAYAYCNLISSGVVCLLDAAMVQANQAKHFNNQYGKRQMLQISVFMN
jgi:hypothetical protein